MSKTNTFFSKTLFVPATKAFTQPYWLANKMEEGYFNVSDQQKIGQADVDPSYTATITLNIEGQDLQFEMERILADAMTPVFVLERPEGGLGGFIEAGTRKYADGCSTTPVPRGR